MNKPECRLKSSANQVNRILLNQTRSLLDRNLVNSNGILIRSYFTRYLIIQKKLYFFRTKYKLYIWNGGIPNYRRMSIFSSVTTSTIDDPLATTRSSPRLSKNTSFSNSPRQPGIVTLFSLARLIVLRICSDFRRGSAVGSARISGCIETNGHALAQRKATISRVYTTDVFAHESAQELDSLSR